MSAEALTLNQADSIKFIAAAALASGEIIQLSDGRAAVVGGMKGFAINESAVAYPVGAFSILSASGTTFAVGDPVYWDVSASLAVTVPGAVDDLYLGTARKAKASGETRVETDLNVGNAGAGSTGQRGVWTSRVAEIEHDDTAEHDLIAAAENPKGLAVMAFVGQVTEAPAGSSEDQLVITLYDEDDNVLSVMTTTDGTPDAIGDIVKGTCTIADAATGDVFAIIPAGKGAYAKVSQATAGTPAGKIKVRALVCPLE